MRRIKGWFDLVVRERVQETPDTCTLYLQDKASDSGDQLGFDYRPGQYLTFRFDGLVEKPVVRSYTMSSSPRLHGRCGVTVKKVDNGLVSHHLVDQLKVGDTLRARGPIGAFCFPEAHAGAHLVMVAAGSGMTPFWSILQHFYDRLGQPGCPGAMTLLVAYRTMEDAIGLESLRQLEKDGAGKIRVQLSLTRSKEEGAWHGRPDAGMLDELLGGQYGHDATYMTCGPEAMMQMVVNHLKDKGVQEDRILLESFA